MSLKKLLSVTLVIAMLVGILPMMGLTASAAEIVLDKDSQEYSEVSGLFFDDATLKDEAGKTTRYSFSENAKLVYTPQIETAGNYEVFYYNAASMSNQSQQQVVVKSDAGEQTVTFYLKENPGWKSLGVYQFTPGGEAEISLSRGLKGGCIRSGAVKLVSTDKEVAVAPDEEVPGPKREDLTGIVIATNNEGYEEVNGDGEVDYSDGTNGANFMGSSLVDCKGFASRYGLVQNCKMLYRPTIPEAGEYHVLYYVINHSSNQKAQKTIVHYAGGEQEFELDCTAHDGWVYLGKYQFNEGTDGYLETIKNETEGFLRSGGARFVSVNDATFDPSQYATPDKPGSGTPTTPPTTEPTTPPTTGGDGAPETSPGVYIIGTKAAGYQEEGPAAEFFDSTSLMDCTGVGSRYASGKAEKKFIYTPNIKEAGEYEVFYYVMQHESNAKSQKIVIKHQDGEEELTLDCTAQNGWVSLGKYKFAAGTEGCVETLSEGSNGNMRSGGVKFEKQ